MILTLKDRNGLVKAEFGVSDNSVQEKELHGDNVLNVSFTLYEYIPIDVTDYVDFEGERYWAMAKYQPREKSSMEWEYSFSLYGIESIINRFLVINYTDGDDSPEFVLTGTAQDHARLIVKSINEGLGQERFSVGTVVSTANIVIDYKGKYCVEGLSEVANAADTEYWFDGYMLNLCRCERGEPLTMGYGNGLTSLSREPASGSKFWTRLFPIGSSRNIDVEQYGHSRLQLPGGAKYVDKDADKYGVWHHYEESAFADIYPRRVGTVSSVRSETKTSQDGKTFTIWYFKDSGLDFDPNDYEIGGLVKRVSFQEGSELAGLGIDDGHYFEVNYDSQTQEFEIITIWPYDDDTQLPGGMLVPQVGDDYILWNIRMPDHYYTLAEEELAEAVGQYIEDHWKDNNVYKGATDHVWVEDQAAALYVGRRIRLESQEYFPEDGFRQSRVTKVTRNINLPSCVDLEIGDLVATGFKTSVNNSIAEVRNYAQRLELTFPDIIKTGEEKAASDHNVWSALRCLREFLSTSRDGSTSGLIGFAKGLWVKAKGLFGIDENGDAALKSINSSNTFDLTGKKWGIDAQGNASFDGDVDIDGDATIEGTVNSGAVVTKTLTAQDAHFFNLIIDEVKSVGGQMIVSPANAQIGKVIFYDKDGNVVDEDDTETPITAYYLWIKKEDDKGNAITMQFESGDLILHMEFNVAQAQTRNYWMRVEAALDNNYTMDFDGVTRPAYLLLITPNAEQVKAGSARPRKGDHIAVFGNRTNAARQNAIVISAYNIPFIDPEPYNGDNNGIQAPLFVEYTGVGSWTQPEDRFKVKDANRKNVIARNGTRLRGDFQVWNSSTTEYDSVTTLIQALANSITLRVSSIENTVSNGLRNLILNSNFQEWVGDIAVMFSIVDNTTAGDTSVEQITSNLPVGLSSGIMVTCQHGYDGIACGTWSTPPQPNFPIVAGKKYTFSWWVKTTGASSLYIEADVAYSSIPTSTTWERKSLTFTAKSDNNENNRITILCMNADTMYLTGCQLEEGDKMTSWRPASEDVEMQMKELSQQSQLILQQFRAELAVLQNNLVRAGIVLDGVNSRIELIGRRVTFKTTEGRTYIQTGVDNDGYPMLEFLDPDGVPRYDLGYRGLTQIIEESHPQEWESLGSIYGYRQGVYYLDTEGLPAGFRFPCEDLYDNPRGTVLSKPTYINHEPYTYDRYGDKIYPMGGYTEGMYYINRSNQLLPPPLNSDYLPAESPIGDGWYAMYARTEGTREYFNLFYISNGKPLNTTYTIQAERLSWQVEGVTYYSYHVRILETIEGYTPSADNNYLTMPPVPSV